MPTTLNAPAEQVTWNRLAGQRWGGASSTPGRDIRPDWRWEVASWPIERWLDWRRRCDDLIPEGATLAVIRAVERVAYDDLIHSDDVTS